MLLTMLLEFQQCNIGCSLVNVQSATMLIKFFNLSMQYLLRFLLQSVVLIREWRLIRGATLSSKKGNRNKVKLHSTQVKNKLIRFSN